MSWLPWSLSFSVLASKTGFLVLLILLPTVLVFFLLWWVGKRQGKPRGEGRDGKRNYPDFDE